MDRRTEYELDEIGGEPLLDSGFENEEPEQFDEVSLEDTDSELGGDAA